MNKRKLYLKSENTQYENESSSKDQVDSKGAHKYRDSIKQKFSRGKDHTKKRMKILYEHWPNVVSFLSRSEDVNNIYSIPELKNSISGKVWIDIATRLTELGFSYSIGKPLSSEYSPTLVCSCEPRGSDSAISPFSIFSPSTVGSELFDNGAPAVNHMAGNYIIINQDSFENNSRLSQQFTAISPALIGKNFNISNELKAYIKHNPIIIIYIPLYMLNSKELGGLIGHIMYYFPKKFIRVAITDAAFTKHDVYHILRFFIDSINSGNVVGFDYPGIVTLDNRIFERIYLLSIGNRFFLNTSILNTYSYYFPDAVNLKHEISGTNLDKVKYIMLDVPNLKNMVIHLSDSCYGITTDHYFKNFQSPNLANLEISFQRTKYYVPATKLQLNVSVLLNKFQMLKELKIDAEGAVLEVDASLKVYAMLDSFILQNYLEPFQLETQIFQNIKSIEFENLAGLAHIDALEDCEKLISLKIHNCPNIISIENLNLNQLKSFSFTSLHTEAPFLKIQNVSLKNVQMLKFVLRCPGPIIIKNIRATSLVSFVYNCRSLNTLNFLSATIFDDGVNSPNLINLKYTVASTRELVELLNNKFVFERINYLIVHNIGPFGKTVQEMKNQIENAFEEDFPPFELTYYKNDEDKLNVSLTGLHRIGCTDRECDSSLDS